MIDRQPAHDIDRTAPATTVQERVVAASPEQVFALLADVEAWPTWQPKVSKASSDGPFTIGSTFRWRSGAAITSTVTVFEPGRTIAWTGRALGTHAVHTWALEAVGGGTRVLTEESMSGWLPRVMTRTVQRTLDQGVSAVLDALETAVAR